MATDKKVTKKVVATGEVAQSSSSIEVGQVFTGKLVSFTYVGQKTSWCRVTIMDKTIERKGIIGKAKLFPFRDMMTLKGAGATARLTYSGNDGEWDNYSAEFGL